MSPENVTEHERTSLEAHVDLCALRYKHLDNRMDKLEGKLDKLHETLESSNSSLTKVIIGAVATIVASCGSVIIAIILGG